MGFDQKGEVKIVKPDISNSKYLWKYFDIHKLLDFIISQELHFTRLDLLEDPIEGLSTSQLRASNLLELIEEKENQEKIDSIKKKFPDLLPYAEIREGFGKWKQKLQFVNCWFHGGRESMAMWNLYSNQDSVAIRFEAEDLLKHLEKIAEEFINEHGYLYHVMGDTVKYLPLNPFDPDLPPQRFEYSAFKKDQSYGHEFEYRLLIYAHSKLMEGKDIKFLKLPVQVHSLNPQIICHPLMAEWKRKNIEAIVNKFEIGLEVRKSNIILVK